MVECAERDRMVLSLLAPDDRAQIEAVVDEMLEDAPSLFDESYLLAAAGAFDARAETLPSDQKGVAIVASRRRLATIRPSSSRQYGTCGRARLALSHGR